MNMLIKHPVFGDTVAECIANAHLRLDGDIVGLWHCISRGRVGYGFIGGDLREFVFLYVFTLLSHGGITIDGARDGVHYWAAVDRYGTKPEEIAHNVTAEWIDQGEPDPPPWESLAFALPDYLASPENRRDWPKPHIELPG